MEKGRSILYVVSFTRVIFLFQLPGFMVSLQYPVTSSLSDQYHRVDFPETDP